MTKSPYGRCSPARPTNRLTHPSASCSLIPGMRNTALCRPVISPQRNTIFFFVIYHFSYLFIPSYFSPFRAVWCAGLRISRLRTHCVCHCMAHIYSWCICDVCLCLVVCDHRAFACLAGGIDCTKCRCQFNVNNRCACKRLTRPTDKALMLSRLSRITRAHRRHPSLFSPS